jgi:hypothetical protein
MRVRLVSLEGPFKLAEALAILVSLGFDLSQLRKLRGLVVLRRWVHLPVVSMCPGIFPCCGSSSTGGGILRVVRGSHGSVDVEALPCRVIAVEFRVGVWLSVVETSRPSSANCCLSMVMVYRSSPKRQSPHIWGKPDCSATC